MARTRELKIIVAGDDDRANKMWRRQRDEADKTAKHMRLTTSVTSKGFAGVRAAAFGAVAGIGAAAVAAKSFVDAASDVNESLTKNQALFGKYAKGIERFSKSTATSIGVSRREALAAAGTFGGLFDAINIGEKQSAKMSQRLVTLAADLASFNNASPEEALEALRSGLAGEAEPMRRFNAFLSETRVKAEAARLGIGQTAVDTGKLKVAQEQASIAQGRYNVAVARYGETSIEARTAHIAVANAQERAKKASESGTAELTEAQKVQARYSLILRDTAKAQGDFNKTKDGDANQTRILKAQYDDLTVSLGNKLLPAKLKVTRALNRFIGEMQDGTGQGGKFVDTLEDIWRETKPIVEWVGRATKNVVEFAQEHPKVTKLAAAVVGVGLAIKGLRIASAATGFTDLLKVSGAAARAMKRAFVRRAAEAGAEAAATTAAEYGVASTAAGAKYQKAGRLLGTRFGKGLVIGAIAGLVAFGPDIVKWLDKSLITAPKRLGESIGAKLGKLLGTDSGDSDSGKMPRGKAGNLMGARRSLAPFAAIGAGYGLSVTSGRRPGSITSSGNVSYHSTGEAIDVAGPAGRMLAFARRLRDSYGGRLAELIYTPMGTGVKDGRPHRYSGQVAADHFDHVHVAVDTGRAGVGDGYGRDRIKSLWTTAGGPAATANLAAAVALAESGGNPAARNTNRDGSTDRGLWQINSIHGRLSTFDPMGNARAAVRISSAGRNWRPWVAYTGGAYKRFLTTSGSSGNPSAEGLQSQLDRNQDRIDALRNQLDRAPKGLAGTAQRDRIQDQIRALQSRQRGLRGDLRDAPSAADIRESQERAGSRQVSGIVAPYMKGFRLTSGHAKTLGGEIEDDETRYGQTERLYGQSEEDLGTPGGRAQRISELGALAVLKAKTLDRQKRRAMALVKAISNRDSMLKRLRRARSNAKGAKRAKMNERIRAYEESLDDLKAELKALGFAIKDTELDIGDLAKEAGETARTADTEGPTPGERADDLISLIGDRERAGVIDKSTADMQREQVWQAALGGSFGALDERQRLKIMGDAKEAQEAGVAALAENTQALRDLQTEMARQNAISESVVGVSLREAQRALADMISGQLGTRTANRRMLPGTGALARL